MLNLHFYSQECKIEMTVMSGANKTVQLLADQVTFFCVCKRTDQTQVLMMDKDKIPKKFSLLKFEDKDLIMFTITNLTLTKKGIGNMVYLALKLKRKITTDLSY